MSDHNDLPKDIKYLLIYLRGNFASLQCSFKKNTVGHGTAQKSMNDINKTLEKHMAY